MLYRVLGVIAMVIGGLFALVAVLIFLPFLSNYNTSLLVLTLIFAIFAWVFGSIGWQLLHPPRPRADRAAEAGDAAIEGMGPGPEEAALRAAPARADVALAPIVETAPIVPAYAKVAPAPGVAASAVAPVADALRAAVPASAEAGFSTDDQAMASLDDFVGFGDDGTDARAESNGGNGAPTNGHGAVSARPQFRKPGAPLPPDRALG
jgi:hypothetical protein